MKKLHVLAFSLACGLTWALGVLTLALLSMWTRLGGAMIRLLGDIYIGTASTWQGALIGFLWAFTDGFIGALVFVSLYNFFAKQFK